MSAGTATETPHLPQLMSQVFDRLLGAMYTHLVEAGFEDLRPTHCFNVFRFMDCDGTRPTTLARRAGMTPQAMGELVGYLERQGYVRRVPDPTDRRGRVVVYADRGTTAAEVAVKFFAEQESFWSDIVGADRFDDMKLVLTEILSFPTPETTTETKGHM